jgi:hypothetical protein
MAVRLSALSAGRPSPPGRFLVKCKRPEYRDKKTRRLPVGEKIAASTLQDDPSLIRSNWAESPSELVKQKIALKDKELRTQMNRKCNDRRSADESKSQNITAGPFI